MASNYNNTSNTTAQTVITVDQLISFAYSEAGKLAEELTPEYVNRARQALWYILINLSNRGVNLWLLEYLVMGSSAQTRQYEMPRGTVDVREANYRQMTRPSTVSDSTGGSLLHDPQESPEGELCCCIIQNRHVSQDSLTSAPFGSVWIFSTSPPYSADRLPLMVVGRSPRNARRRFAGSRPAWCSLLPSRPRVASGRFQPGVEGRCRGFQIYHSSLWASATVDSGT
jgi:hypothetical protein